MIGDKIEQLSNGDYVIYVEVNDGYYLFGGQRKSYVAFRGNKGDWYDKKTGEKATTEWTIHLDAWLKLKEWEEVDKGNT